MPQSEIASTILESYQITYVELENATSKCASKAMIHCAGKLVLASGHHLQPSPLLPYSTSLQRLKQYEPKPLPKFLTKTTRPGTIPAKISTLLPKCICMVAGTASFAAHESDQNTSPWLPVISCFQLCCHDLFLYKSTVIPSPFF